MLLLKFLEKFMFKLKNWSPSSNTATPLTAEIIWVRVFMTRSERWGLQKFEN